MENLPPAVDVPPLRARDSPRLPSPSYPPLLQAVLQCLVAAIVSDPWKGAEAEKIPLDAESIE
jgi:hypothetical protein